MAVVTAWICRTCANQYPDTAEPPSTCGICTDERQYVPTGGQAWTDLAELAAEGHRTTFATVEPGLEELRVRPSLGIGQRGLLVRTPAGNVLFDPPGYLDAAALEHVRETGGLVAIARSHPHLCGAQVEWSRALGGVPILVACRDRSWITRPDPAVRLWGEREQVLPGVSLLRCGGHFAGSAVLHWEAGAGGRGVLLVGDTVAVLPGGRQVSFMRSYPMQLPLPERYLDRLLAALAGLRYDRIYGAWTGDTVAEGAAAVVADSARRYRGWLTGAFTDPDQD